MSMSKKKQKETNLNEALSAAEGGDVGRMLKGVAEQIEPRAEFARQLEARLIGQKTDTDASLAQVRSVGEPEQPSVQLLFRVPRPPVMLKNLSDRPRPLSRASRVASVAMNMVGVAAVLLAFVFLASMFTEAPTAVPTSSVEPARTALPGTSDPGRLASALHPLLTLPTGSQVRKIAWSRNGRRLATLELLKTDYPGGVVGNNQIDTFEVKLWDATRGHMLLRGTYVNVAELAWSPDGGTLAVGLYRNVVKLLDVGTAGERLTLTAPVPADDKAQDGSAWTWDPNNSGWVRSISWSPDGRLLATASHDPYSLNPASRDGVIRLWDPGTGTLVNSIRVHNDEDPVLAWASKVEWSPDGRVLASASYDGITRIWDAGKGTPRHELVRQWNAHDFTWSPDGQTLAVVADNFVELWDAPTGKFERSLPEVLPPTPMPTKPGPLLGSATVVPGDQYGGLYNVRWSPDGRVVATNDGKTIRLWDPATGALLKAIPAATQGSIQRIDWSSDGRIIASTVGGDTSPRGIQLWDPTTGKELRRLSNAQDAEWTWGFEWSPVGMTLAVQDGKGVTLWGTGAPPPYVTDPQGTTVPNTVTTSTATSMAIVSPTASPDPRRVCSGWSVVDSPIRNTQNELFGVAAVSSDDIWAVGYHSIGNSGYDHGSIQPNVERTLIMHWDGVRWESVQTPDVAGKHNRLLSVAATSADDVWAVGYYGDMPGPGSGEVSQTLVMHWDGVDWEIVTSPDGGTLNNRLHSVIAISENDVWAAGYYDVEFKNTLSNITTISKSLILHWDGKEWTQVESPDPGPYLNKLNSLSAISENDIWAVGEYSRNAPLGGPFGFVTYPLALHWNGSKWSVTETPILDNHYGFFKPLWSVTALSESEVWAVGSSNSEGSQRSVALRWDGKRWVEEKLDIPRPPVESGPPPHDTLLGVAALSKDDVWAVGSFEPYMTGADMGSHVSTLSAHWDGNVWSYVPSPNVTEELPDEGLIEIEVNRLNGIASTPSGELWAVGAVVGRGPASRTLVMRFEGSPCPTPVVKAIASPGP